MKTTLAFGLLIFCATAQADPPELIRVIRGAGSAQPYADAKVPIMILGMAPVSGVGEPWLMEAHDSFESIEAVDRALAGLVVPEILRSTGSDDILPSSRAIIGLFRAAFSYRPSEAEKSLPKARYLMVSIYRVRPGSENSFAELARLRRARFDSINLDRPELAYQVISGAASGTYLFVAPLMSLKVLDDGLAKAPAYAEGVKEASTAANNEIGHEMLLLRIDPRMSLVPEDLAAR